MRLWQSSNHVSSGELLGAGPKPISCGRWVIRHGSQANARPWQCTQPWQPALDCSGLGVSFYYNNPLLTPCTQLNSSLNGTPHFGVNLLRQDGRRCCWVIRQKHDLAARHGVWGLGFIRGEPPDAG